MAVDSAPVRTLGLLPEPERSTGSFVTSAIVNGSILALVLYIGATAKRVIEQHHYEMTELLIPTTPPPQPKVKMPPPPEVPHPPELQMEAPKIEMPKPKPEPKPIQMEAKLAMPTVKMAKPQIILAPQPKAALAAAAMPAQSAHVKVSTAPVHLGQTFGVTPNPNAMRAATIAAIGNPYGGMQGPAVAPHGIVGSTGIGNGTHFGSSAGTVGRVASAGIPGSAGNSPTGTYGRVAAAGIPKAAAAPVVAQMTATPQATNLEVISKPPVQYTTEARQLKVQGDVVLRVTFMATGQVVVQGIVHGLGHGLDEEARRVAQQIRFRPATRDGRPVDLTTTIRITFQLA
jgi:TonB family protein